MVFAFFAVLLLGQPDLGTVVVMLVTLFGMLFIAGAKLTQFLALMIAGIGAVVGSFWSSHIVFAVSRHS